MRLLSVRLPGWKGPDHLPVCLPQLVLLRLTCEFALITCSNSADISINGTQDPLTWKHTNPPCEIGS